MTTISGRISHHYQHASNYISEYQNTVTLWAREDLNLGPLPCQGIASRLNPFLRAGRISIIYDSLALSRLPA